MENERDDGLLDPDAFTDASTVVEYRTGEDSLDGYDPTESTETVEASKEQPTAAEGTEKGSEEASPPEKTPGTEEATGSTEEAATHSEGTSGTEGDSGEEEFTEQPWGFSADGQHYEVPDAIETSDGWVHIPAEQVQKVLQPHFADRAAWQRERNQLQRQVQLLQQSQGENEARAGVILQKFTEMLDKGPDEIVKWAIDFEQNRPRLEAEAERAAVAAERHNLELSQQVTENRAVEQQTETAMQDAWSHVLDDAARSLEKYAPLDFEDIHASLDPIRNSFFFVAPPQGIQFDDGTVLRGGEMGVRVDLIEQYLDRELEKAERQRIEAENRTAVSSSATRNEPAPVAGSGSSTGRSAPKPLAKPKTREEYEAYLSQRQREIISSFTG